MPEADAIAVQAAVEEFPSKAQPTVPGWRGWTPPDPWLGVSIELPSGGSGRQCDLFQVHEGLASQRGSPKEPPPNSASGPLWE